MVLVDDRCRVAVVVAHGRREAQRRGTDSFRSREVCFRRNSGFTGEAPIDVPAGLHLELERRIGKWRRGCPGGLLRGASLDQAHPCAGDRLPLCRAVLGTCRRGGQGHDENEEGGFDQARWHVCIRSPAGPARNDPARPNGTLSGLPQIFSLVHQRSLAARPQARDPRGGKRGGRLTSPGLRRKLEPGGVYKLRGTRRYPLRLCTGACNSGDRGDATAPALHGTMRHGAGQQHADFTGGPVPYRDAADGGHAIRPLGRVSLRPLG